MKRIVLAAAVVMLSLASCRKDYVCTANGVEVASYKKLGKTQKEGAKSSCILSGGTFSEK